jgi:glutaredoxin 3
MRDEIMPDIIIYTTPFCPYCARAKGLLKRKNATFTEIDVSEDESRRGAMRARSQGRNSVPQIFIGSTHVGGCDDIHALDSQGKLDALLAA